MKQIREAVHLTDQVDGSLLKELLEKNVFDDPQPVVPELTFTVGSVGWWDRPT